VNLIAKVLIAWMALFLSLSGSRARAQSPSPARQDAITVEGTVRSAGGAALPDAGVFLEGRNHSKVTETRTRADGTFIFSVVEPGTFTLWADKSGWRKSVSSLLVLSAGDKKRVDLVLEPLAAAPPDSSSTSSNSRSSPAAIDFDDQPTFTVAGVTDWNNAGMHGSDATLR
jgi:Carboxypeptidase regulatory-like domain